MRMSFRARARMAAWAPGARGLGLGSTPSTELNVHGGDATELASFGDSLGGHHSGVRGRLITVSLNLHATSDTADGLHPREISHVDEGVVEGRENVRDAKD